MATDEEVLDCATVLVTGGLLLQQSIELESEPVVDEDPEAYACAAVLVAGNLLLQQAERPKRKWSEEWLLRRNDKGSYATLNQELIQSLCQFSIIFWFLYALSLKKTTPD